MRFIKGDPNRLHGRAVIFMELKEAATLPDGSGELSLLTVFCAATELDLLELIVQVMHLPREHSRLISRFYKRYFQEIEKIKRSFPKRITRIIDEIIEAEQEEISAPTLESFRYMFRHGVPNPEKDPLEVAEEELENEAESEKNHSGERGRLPEPDFYSTLIPLPGLEIITLYSQLEAGLEFDIIDLERTEHVEIGHLVLDAHARLYVADYMNQKEREMELPGHQSYKSPYKNYKQLSREQFKSLLTELSSELMFLIETGSGTDRVFADLKQLTSGSFLLREVVSMYNISTTQDPNKIKLMELFFRKIFSLLDEDYLLTRQIEEEIHKYSV
ncbi:MAG: hypothetical protein A3F83_05395 [Candidatus Glassbacteria bacterium RIFCSPLOWO2_12_FULL_58_11]|uniref:Uncharacterized protein n=1 Tax=Candidatus Glassbacteria bacterium RIFCSPLOWO2_12_FULL_58_11 TaxID=1817867 RepID=A0A1F5YV02_9BACT|nr:MAG: hypothetical protein A3F83_05395 [Candidatus Glassbacteria bacterium RIFCSPLOWO2_12_FULL_58_11]